jgi:CubicO group peptidase (beta-lactamase class C family)
MGWGRRRWELSKRSLHLVSGLVAVLLLTTAAVGHVPAAGGAVSTTPQASVEPVEPASSVEVGAIVAFMDSEIPSTMEDHDTPGGVFVLVADGDIAHAQGYGHTDTDQDTAIDPRRTRFDIGSVSKLLTATAVMQQVEQGRLDLHADVDTYLTEVRVPEAFGQPVTPAHLLTHTAGFAEHYLLGSMTSQPGQVAPLAEILSPLPERVRPPGVAHQYDNIGMALAGHLVEVASGDTFEDYVTAQILEPLGMTRSSYGRPVPDAHDVTPHEMVPGLGTTGAVPPVYVTATPTGGLWTTGEDMAAFMLAHLADGEHDGTRILESSSVAAMQDTQFTPHPASPGIGYGFFEHNPGPHRGVQHGGSWVGASAHLYLLPEADLGFFVAFNHGSGVEFTHTLIYEALEHAFPEDHEATAEPTADDTDLGALAGQYRWNRHDRSTFMRLVSTLTSSRLQVTDQGDGTLGTTMAPFHLLPDATWLPSDAGVFVERGGTGTLVFDTDDTGAVDGLHAAGAQLFSMEPIAWYDTAGFVAGLLAFFLAVALIAAVGWPAGALRRRLRQRGEPVPADLRRARRLTGLAGGLMIAFGFGLLAHFALDMAGLLQVSLALRALLLLPLAGAIAVVALDVVVVRLWRNGGVSLAGRLYHSGIAIVLLAALPFLWHLRLLGFHY